MISELKLIIILIALIILIIIGLIGYGLSVCPGETDLGYVPGYLNVYFKENITYQEAEDIIKSYDLRHSQQDASPEIKANYQIIFDELRYLGVIVPEGKEQKSCTAAMGPGPAAPWRKNGSEGHPAWPERSYAGKIFQGMDCTH